MTYQKGDRVVRLSYPDRKPLYEAEVAEVIVIHERGVRKTLYRLAAEDGSPSPVKIAGSYLRPVEAP